MARSLLAKLVVAAALVAAVTLVKLQVPAIGRDLPFLLYFVSVFGATIYGGVTGGVVATLLSAVAANVLFFPPYGQPSIDLRSLFQAATFLTEGALIVLLWHKLELARVAQREARLESDERARRLDEALARAEEAVLAKDAFLATISHELRTPLNAILGWSHMLRSDLTPERRARALDVIERNTQAQVQLIEDLLDMTRITSGKLRLEVQPVNLVDVIESAVDSLRPSAEAKQQRLLLTLDTRAGTVAGDPNRLQQVVWNLLSNAVKFTPKEGRVQVVLERVDSQVALTVSDSGQGIDTTFLPYVFDSFRQADGSTTRRHGGLGLGLAISKHIVALHGGTLAVHSDGIGRGATFTVQLPVAPVRVQSHAAGAPVEPPRAGGRPRECPAELDGLRVLIVDDEADSRELLASVLAECGAESVQAANVAEAFEQIDARLPDVVLSDIGMPGEDGYAFIEKLRARPREAGGALPVAALTAYARAEDRKRALRAGFQMHVAKPIEPAELLVIVASLARMQKLMA